MVTIFPGMVEGPLSDGIIQRAREKGLVDLHVHDLRDHTDDRHRSVDDEPFGGGPDMVMKAEPFFRAVEAIRAEAPAAAEAVVLLSPRGRRFDQEAVRRFARLDRSSCSSAAATRGSVERALAAYNAGPHRVTAWTEERPEQSAEEFAESIPFTETRYYVMNILAAREQYRRLYALGTAAAPGSRQAGHATGGGSR